MRKGFPLLLVLLVIVSLVPTIPVHVEAQEEGPSFGYTAVETVKTNDPSIISSVYFDGANYVYITPYGNYTWLQPGNILRYTNLDGDVVVEKSVFVLQYDSYGTWLPLLDFTEKDDGPVVYQANDTYYDFRYNVYDKKVIIASVRVTFVVEGLNKPKISVSLNKTQGWDVEFGGPDFRWIWDIVPYIDDISGDGWKYWRNSTAGSVLDITTIEGIIELENVSRTRFTDEAIATGNSKWCSLDVADYGGVIFEGGTEPNWNSKGFVAIFPVNAADIDPITYTEDIDSFAIAADATWTEYDLFTNKGVPKGAIAEIVCANKNEGIWKDVGVRTKGSSLLRNITLHEAEGLGVHTVTMFVKTDASDGKIECYAETQGDVDFYVLGYFTGIDFTESIASLGSPGVAWADKDLSGDSVPANAVVQIMMANGANDADYFAGVRADGSGLERGVTLDEAEDGSKDGGEGWSVLSTVVKANGNSIIEWKAGSATAVEMWVLGWFGNTMDFIEGFTDYSPASDSTWTNKTISEAPVNSTVVFALVHQDPGTEIFSGIRTGGSAANRYIEEHEAEGGSSSGFQACANTNIDQRVEVYCEDASEAQFYYMGYFSEHVLMPTEIEQQRKVFKNPRGQGYYYRLSEDALGDWDFHYSSSGDSWTDSGVGVDCPFSKQPSLSIFEDAGNTRLVVVVSYIAADGNLDVQAFAIADAGVTIASLWTDDSVATGMLSKPSVTVDASGYIWASWADGASLKITRTDATYPLSAPTWETTVTIDTQTDIVAELVPLTATADIAVVYSYGYTLKGVTLTVPAGTITEGTTVTFDTSIYSDLLHSSVAESGAASDVFIGYKNLNGDFLCSKWDISEDTWAAFGIIHSATDVDSLSLSIDKNADPDVLYAFYVKTGVPGDVFYKTIPVDEVFGLWGSTYSAGSDPNNAWTDDPNAWDNWPDSYAYTTVAGENNRIEGTTVRESPGSSTITKVEAGLRLRNPFEGMSYLRPVFDGSLGDTHQYYSYYDVTVYVDITTDTNAPSPWTWEEIQKIDLRYWTTAIYDDNFLYEFHLKVTQGAWSAEETIDDDGESLDYLSACYSDIWNSPLIWESYYSAGNDPGAAWTDDADAWNQNEADYAQTSNGILENHRLEGTTIHGTPPSQGSIIAIFTGAKTSFIWNTPSQASPFNLRPVFDGSLGDAHPFQEEGWVWADVTTDTNAPDPWTWADIPKIDIRVWGTGGGSEGGTTDRVYEFAVRVVYELESDGDIQLIYTRMTSKTVGFFQIGGAEGEEYLRFVSQSLSMVGTVYRFCGFVRLGSQGMSMTSSVDRTWSTSRLTSTALTLTPTALRTWSLTRALTQGLSLSSGVERLWQTIRTISQPLSLSSGVLRGWSLSRGLGQSLTLSSGSERSWSLTRVLSQPLSFAFNTFTQISQLFERTVSLGFTLVSSAIRSWIVLRDVSQGISTSFNAERLWWLSRMVSQSISFTSNTFTDLLSLITRMVSLTVSTSFSSFRGWSLMREFSQSITATLSADRILVAIRQASQNIAFEPGAERLVTFIRGLAQSITMSSEALRTWSLSRTLSQGLSFASSIFTKWTEYIPTPKEFYRSVSVGIAFASDSIRQWSQNRVLSQGISFASNSLRQWSLSRTFSQSLSLFSGALAFIGIMQMRLVSLSLEFASSMNLFFTIVNKLEVPKYMVLVISLTFTGLYEYYESRHERAMVIGTVACGFWFFSVIQTLADSPNNWPQAFLFAGMMLYIVISLMFKRVEQVDFWKDGREW